MSLFRWSSKFSIRAALGLQPPPERVLFVAELLASFLLGESPVNLDLIAVDLTMCRRSFHDGAARRSKG